jgi:putative ABC transport system permease protein
MLGIVFGVGAVIAMLSIGAGAEQEALETINRLGLRNIVVRDRPLDEEEAREVRAISPGLSLRDVEAIADGVRGVEQVAPKARIRAWQVVGNGATAEAEVLGVAAEHAELVDLSLAEGRFLDALDVREHAQVAVIGANVRRDLFGLEPVVGAALKVNDVWLEVVGVLASGGSEIDAFQGVQLGSPAGSIYLPISTALRKLERRPLDAPLAEIVVRVAPGASAVQVADLTGSLLDHLHGRADDYQLVVPEALLAESRRTQRLFNIVMGCIAGISLLVGGIGIMNIMLASVLERTREIGVRRAVGARRRDILRQFLAESFALSAIGGCAGIVMGVAIAATVAALADWTTRVTLWSVVLATGVAMVVGLVSGLYPALRAADLDPIESLRYE